MAEKGDFTLAVELIAKEVIKRLVVEVYNSSSMEHRENGVETKVTLKLDGEVISESKHRTSIYHYR